MSEVTELKPCCNPGCDQLGTKSCSACKSTFYCSVLCQTANWPSHSEECDGHLRKVGKANLEKAKGFHRQQNWVQALRYGEIAATKLKKLKDRRLETVQIISSSLVCQLNSLQFMRRHREAKGCAEENYTLWAMNHMRNPYSMTAAFSLIQSCLHNNEFEDAEHYARHAMFMINDMNDNFIPSDQRSEILAEGSHCLATAILLLARNGGIPQEGKQKAGKEAIVLARQALEIHRQLHGTESTNVAMAIGTLADVLGYFNNIEDDEIPRLFEQSIAIYRRMEGTSSLNVAVGEEKLSSVYYIKARIAEDEDLDLSMANFDLALTHLQEAVRIYRVINHVDKADDLLRKVVKTEEDMRRIRIAIEVARTAEVAAGATARTEAATRSKVKSLYRKKR